jgi:hypothetical protein
LTDSPAVPQLLPKHVMVRTIRAPVLSIRLEKLMLSTKVALEKVLPHAVQLLFIMLSTKVTFIRVQILQRKRHMAQAQRAIV